MKGKKIFGRMISFFTVFALTIPTVAQLSVSAEESEKYPYSVFGRNGITMSASSNLCMNGNMHTNKNADISYLNGNINGRITTGADIEKRVKHVYSDTKIKETHFSENVDLHEEEYEYSDLNIHINNPLFCYNNLSLDGNVSLNSNLGSLMNIHITGEVKNANTSVVYSKYGDITIENDSTANINGLIYVPLGTLTINSPNINLNGVIIADKIVINGSSVNINYKDDIARFIGTVSESYDFSDLHYLPEDWLGDTDKDQLFDIYEKVIDTDPLDSDTDDDQLPDGYEVITLNTDPLEIDTDENGVSDADEDFDEDNLNNLGEYTNKTEPYNPDTDDDLFLDGDEIKKYHTDPLDSDTDKDGLLDGEESKDGHIYKDYGKYFDPLKYDTDGNGISDGDEVFGQSKKQEVETHDKVITEIKVDMATNGDLERNLTIESMYNIDMMSTNTYALIGEPFNFETPTNFDSATITFKIDKTKLGDTDFDNLLILWYNEENQVFEEMETICDEANSTVSTTTTHFSQYMIVDSEKWFAKWSDSFDKLKKMWSGNTSYYKSLNTILIVDCSWKMENVDHISYSIEVGYNGVTQDNVSGIRACISSGSNVDYYLYKYGRRKCNRAYICENIINNMSSGDYIALMMYGSGVQSNTGLTSSYGSLMSAVQNVNNNGGSMYLNNAVSAALSYVSNDVENMYRIVVLTSGDVSFGYDLSSYDYTNVSLNVVSLGGGVSSYLENIVYGTGGDIYYGYPSSSLTGASGGSVTIPPQFVGEDSDGDGIPDLVEEYGLKPNGQPINSDPNNKHSDKDGLEDNEELHFSRDSMTYELDKSQYDGSVFIWSDPCLEDTDGDGLDDKLDNEPLNKKIHSFVIYETETNEDDLHLINTYYGNDERRPEDFRYADLSKDDLRNMDHIYCGDFFNRDYFENWKGLTKLLSMGDMEDVAIEMMEHFIDGTGTDFHSDILNCNVDNHENTTKYTNAVDSVIKKILSKTNGNLYSLKYNKNNRENSQMVMKMQEEIDSGNEDVYSPFYDDKFGGLGITVDDLAGHKIEVSSFKLEGNHYSGTLHYTMYDIYGLDSSDITDEYALFFDFGLLNGFRHWYILQHWDEFGGQNRPFITYMEFDRDFEGYIS